MKKTYVGSCHCGAVRFEADIDLSAGTFKCNCSICAKTRNWLAAVKPEAFRLLAGEGDLTEYQFNKKRIHHLFCKHCGIRPFGWADIAAISGKQYVVNVAALDNATADELVSSPVTYFDGRHDNFQSPPTETRHL
ncbi:MAG: hypothetical protein V7606_80 [Burkholderiales bacterium]|jgi:hypothetical protein|nr:hypothetical protein [Burkholderia sp.]